MTISNWGYTRDVQQLKSIPSCTINDFVIGVKMASTSFAPANSALGPQRDDECSSSSTNFATESSYNDYDEDDQFFFDRNGASIPYAAFVSLLKNEDFVEAFMSSVKKEFERVEGSAVLLNTADEHLDEGGSDEVLVEEDDEEEEIKKKSKTGSNDKGKKKQKATVGGRATRGSRKRVDKRKNEEDRQESEEEESSETDDDDRDEEEEGAKGAKGKK